MTTTHLTDWTTEETELAEALYRCDSESLAAARALLKIERLEARKPERVQLCCALCNTDIVCAGCGNKGGDADLTKPTESEHTPKTHPFGGLCTCQHASDHKVPHQQGCTEYRERAPVRDYRARHDPKLPTRFTAPEPLPVGARVRIVELGSGSHAHDPGDCALVISDNDNGEQNEPYAYAGDHGTVRDSNSDYVYLFMTPRGSGTWVRTVELAEEPARVRADNDAEFNDANCASARPDPAYFARALDSIATALGRPAIYAHEMGSAVQALTRERDELKEQLELSGKADAQVKSQLCKDLDAAHSENAELTEHNAALRGEYEYKCADASAERKKVAELERELSSVRTARDENHTELSLISIALRDKFGLDPGSTFEEIREQSLSRIANSERLRLAAEWVVGEMRAVSMKASGTPDEFSLRMECSITLAAYDDVIAQKETT